MRILVFTVAIIMTLDSVSAAISIQRNHSAFCFELKYVQTQFIPDNLLYTGENIEPNDVPDKTINAWINWPKDNPALQFVIVVVYTESNSENSNSLTIAEERGAWLLKHLVDKGAIEGEFEVRYKIGEIAQAYVEGIGLKENK